jgi:hypothetical protein
VENYRRIGELSDVVSTDPNIVMGRISALYIVPRMIEAHPVTGIGFGNYPLMRNSPEYLGSLPTITDTEDLPAIGYPAITAEIGIPATIGFILLLFAPYRASRKHGTMIVVAALFQPLVNGFGVATTFFYPWFVSACALAAAYTESHRPPQPAKVTMSA